MSSSVILSLFDMLAYKTWFDDDGQNLMDIVEMLRKVNESSKALLKHSAIKHKIQFYNYADNLLFWTTDLSELAVNHFFFINSFVFNLLMEAGRPIRGAISTGEVYFSSQDNIFTGKALVEAHNCEKDQEWLGVALCESVEKNYPPQLLEESSWIVKHAVPQKSGSSIQRWVLNWPMLRSSIPDAYHSHLCNDDDLDRLETNAPKSAKQKYKHTRVFFRQRVSQDKSFVPAETA